MDQNSTNGTDKRNWRERLGIGTKEMPRISEEFNPEPAATTVTTPKVVTAPVKPAPMAPRVGLKPAVAVPAPRPVAARPAGPIDSDALASKLKSQREAAEKLAEQRVQAARQRAEAINVTPVAAATAKPKFTFADEEAKPQGSVLQSARAPQVTPSPQQARPPVLPPQVSQQPQMAPPRPQLGGAVPPRVPNPSFQTRPQMQAPLQPPPVGYQPPYNPNLGYRPVDPSTGYAPPPQYVPNQGFARQQSGFTPQQQPRLQVPPRVPQPGDYGYGQETRPNPRLNNPAMRPPVQPQYGEADPDDIFEQPAPRMQRRATANDYQQAYREVETGYEDEGQKSRGPLILLLLLGLALIVGFGSVWAYNNFVKPQATTSSAVGDVPVVKAPDAPAKVSGDNAATADPQAGTTVSPSKKQIYDRIVGDREVLGGQIVPTEETPVQPAANSQPIPAPDALTVPSATTNDDGSPLPVPPPAPPPDGTGQQGSLEPSAKGDQQDATITPAAGASQAAVAPSGGADTQIKLPDPATSAAAASKSIADVPIPEAPVPGEQIADLPAKPVVQEAVVSPVKKIVAPKPELKKVADAKIAKSLGSKPVVLVPPAKKVATSEKSVVLAVPETPSADGGLYGDSAAVADAPAAAVTAPVKKRKSLFDLFKNTSQPTAQDGVAVAAPQVIPPEPQQVALAQKTPSVPTSSAYVAQLASFKSKAEATQEYRNLSARHGAIITRYAPIISEAQVAGTTRYRLSIGPMATSDVAGGVCQSLFAAGERDCLVHRQ